MASSLFEWAITEIDVAARGRGHLAGANAIFLEAMGEERMLVKEKKSDRVFMSGSALHVLFEQLGWRLVDFDFVPPPQVTEFGEMTYNNRLLLVRVTSNIPRFTQVCFSHFFHAFFIAHFFSTRSQKEESKNFLTSTSRLSSILCVIIGNPSKTIVPMPITLSKEKKKKSDRGEKCTSGWKSSWRGVRESPSVLALGGDLTCWLICTRTPTPSY